MDPIYLADIVNVGKIFPYRGDYGTHFWNEILFFVYLSVGRMTTTRRRISNFVLNSTRWKSEVAVRFLLLNLGKYSAQWSNVDVLFPSKILVDVVSHRIHGAGISTYIYHKNQPFM